MLHMLKISAFICFFMFTKLLTAQSTTVLSTLHNSVKESSGLIYLNNTLITHNDSDTENYLYEIDATNGNVLRSVCIANAQNTDWEDLAIDKNYIYIGDFGNNQGNRTNLKIYRIAITDYLSAVNDTVFADSILFNYADQTDFSTSNFTTKYDAEAVICFRDSLFIFTKNWSNSTTQIYSLPKIPGNYSIQKQDSINTGLLVTGADYDTINQKIALIAYGFNSANLLEIENISTKISAASLTNYPLNYTASYQIEGVAFANNSCLHVSAEEHSSGSASLYQICTPNLNLNKENLNTPLVYPNPASKGIFLNLQAGDIAFISNGLGEIIETTKSNYLDISSYSKGVYYVSIKKLNKFSTYPFIKK